LSFLDQLTGLASEQAGLFALASLALALVAAVAVLALLVRLRRFARPYRLIQERIREAGLEEALHAQIRAAEENRRSILGLGEDLERLAAEKETCLQKVGLVRYDAFEDLGGQQSFSLCLLDGHRNGILLTHITGRNSTRGYARLVEGGRPTGRIGEEEARALARALEEMDGEVQEEPRVVSGT
jgi:hypothetical protein